METHLTIKHLAGYLPYGLKLTDGKSITELCASYLLIDDGFKNEFTSMCEITSGGKFWIKPILRPLSDLTKHCDGLRLVPCEELLKIRFKKHYQEEAISRYKEICFNDKKVWFQNIGNYNMDVPSIENIAIQPHWVIQKLYEWHFDVYGLIEQNLAIDKNTIL